MTQLSLQDFYDQLDEGDRAYAQEQAEEIKQIANNATIQIGQKLIKVKQRLGYGKFLAWIQKEFEWTRQQANYLMTISKEFSNDKYTCHLPQKMMPAYALASALAKESEEGKQELTARYQEELEDKQLVTSVDKEPPKSLTEAEIKELKRERDQLRANLETLEADMDERINEEVESQTKEEKEKLEKKIWELKQELEGKNHELKDSKKKLKQEIDKYKANPDPETKKDIDNLQKKHQALKAQVKEAKARFDKVKNREKERDATILMVTSFDKMIKKAFEENPEISAAIASLYIDDAHEERFIKMRNAFYNYADLIDKAIKRRGENPSEVTVDVEPL